MVTEPALTGYVTEPFLAAITSRFTQAGYAVLTHDFVSDDALIAVIREIRPFGVLALSGLSDRAETDIQELAVPRVYSSSRGDLDFPRPWEEEIGRMQADYLLDHGAQRILYAAPMQDSPRAAIARARATGAARASKARGLASMDQVTLPPDREEVVAILEDFFKSPGLLGICGFDDAVAASVLAAAHDRGVSVPRCLSVIGVDDVPFAPLLTPPLTTVAIDGWASGMKVAEQFLAPDAQPNADAGTRLVASVVERASVAR